MIRRGCWLWITDPWSGLDRPKDTTLRLMEAALALGQPVAWADVRSLRWQDGAVMLDAARFEPKGAPFNLRDAHTPAPATQESRVDRFSRIHYRVDPPIDLSYLHPLQMIQQTVPSRLVNPGHALALLSEKTIPASITVRGGGLAPRSLVSSDPERLAAFVRSEQVAILKPLHGAQSRGVEKVEAGMKGPELLEKLHQATEGFTRPTMLQQYLPAVMKAGETRLWFVDGRLLACARKVPARGEFKIDMDRGSTLEKAEIPTSLKPRQRAIELWLKRHRIRLAAVDWIDGLITDFNITSPGLIVQMEALLGQNLARRIVMSLSRRP
jgi:glutathione synthase